MEQRFHCSGEMSTVWAILLYLAKINARRALGDFASQPIMRAF